MQHPDKAQTALGVERDLPHFPNTVELLEFVARLDQRVRRMVERDHSFEHWLHSNEDQVVDAVVFIVPVVKVFFLLLLRRTLDIDLVAERVVNFDQAEPDVRLCAFEEENDLILISKSEAVLGDGVFFDFFFFGRLDEVDFEWRIAKFEGGFYLRILMSW